MTLFDDDKPKKKTGHELGCDLSMLSVDELNSRIGILKDEIARLELEAKSKSASKTAAASLFKI